MYPSGFVTVNPERNEYTKHYYNNGKRLASRLMTLQGQFVSQNQLQPQAVSMQAMSATQSPQNCQQQLDAIMQYLANDPAMADCLTAVQNINADTSYPDACAKLYEVNSLNCSPADVIDVVITDPVYTPEEISELDCINAIYQLFYLSVYKSNSTYWLNADVKRCYSQIKGIIMKYFITPEPQRMDPCEFWEYLQQFLPCEPTPTIQEPVPTPTEPITYEPPVMTQPTPVHGFEPVQPSLDRVYYYHGDHLGSSTYVTDNNGRPVAYYDYLPFGEVAVEHNQTTNFNNGYKFNAKELDEATGMSYYGARYYDSRLSVFVSVDPLAEKTMTPYQYVNNNPINLIDPTGMSADGWIGWKSKDGKEHVTYDSDVNTVEEAIAKGYTNVEEVMESGYLVSSEGFYQLNSNGTVLIEEKNELVDVGFYPIRTQDGVLINENNQIKSAAQGFQRGGEFMTYLGLGLSITGVGAKAGGAFIAIGEGMSFAGAAVESIYLFNQERYVEAGVNIAIPLIFKGSTDKVVKMSRKGIDTKSLKNGVNRSTETLIQGTSITIEKTFENK